MTTLPEDIAFVLDQKRRYFWNQRSIRKTDTSYAAHRAIKSLSRKSRQGKVLLYFDKYCAQIGALIDEAVPVFVEVISRVEGMSLADRTATVRQNVEHCIISPSKTRSSIVRWLVDACEHHPSLEVLRASHEDPNIWIAPRWLTPPRTRVESKNGIWFFVAGSKRTRVSREFALTYRKRLSGLPANLPTIDLVNDLKITIGAQLEGVFDRALARCIEKFLTSSSALEKGMINGSAQSCPQDQFASSPQGQFIQPQAEPSVPTPPETNGADQPQLIADRTYFVLEAKTLINSQDKPGEFIGAYSTKDPYLADLRLLCFSDSSKELLRKLESMQADHQKLLIHWAKSKQEFEQFPDVVRTFLSLKEIARTTNLKPIKEAVRDIQLLLHSVPKKRGRPRKDGLTKRILELRDAGHSWGEIRIILNNETGVERTAGAYRNLLRSRRKPADADAEPQLNAD